MELCDLRDKTATEETAELELWVQNACDAMRVALGFNAQEQEGGDDA